MKHSSPNIKNYFRKELPSSEKLGLIFWGMELSSPKPKKLLIFQEGTLKSQAEKISKNKFIHSSS